MVKKSLCVYDFRKNKWNIIEISEDGIRLNKRAPFFILCPVTFIYN